MPSIRLTFGVVLSPGIDTALLPSTSRRNRRSEGMKLILFDLMIHRFVFPAVFEYNSSLDSTMGSVHSSSMAWVTKGKPASLHLPSSINATPFASSWAFLRWMGMEKHNPSDRRRLLQHPQMYLRFLFTAPLRASLRVGVWSQMAMGQTNTLHFFSRAQYQSLCYLHVVISVRIGAGRVWVLILDTDIYLM